MSYLQQTIKAVIRPGDEVGYVAECLEIAVVTQGQTLDETVKHLQEATALHLEGESLEAFGLRDKPTLVLTMELDPVHAQASLGSPAASFSPSSKGSVSSRSLNGAVT